MLVCAKIDALGRLRTTDRHGFKRRSYGEVGRDSKVEQAKGELISYTDPCCLHVDDCAVYYCLHLLKTEVGVH